MTAFELYEQFGPEMPEYIAVPTSACGHIRGLHKGFRELFEAGYINEIPKMIIVQAENNSPIVSAVKQRKNTIIPFTNVKTLAGAITTGNPPGAKEILDKAYAYKWPAESVSEGEILESQKKLAMSGLFVEPSAATSLYAVKKLCAAKKINQSARVLLMLTGSGLKDMGALKYQRSRVRTLKLKQIPEFLDHYL
jgi:threonine synthase